MRKKMILGAAGLACFGLALAQTPCVNGMAGGYPCENVQLLSFMPGSAIGGGDMNDIWGWVDPVDSTEYVLVGRTNGTAFIDISDPINPVFVATLPTQTTNSLWRDIKVFDNHAFIVSEAGGHGMQVVDLTQLGQITNPPQTLQADAVYTGWGNAHNIVINESTGRAYGVGTSTFSGGLHILDINDPLNPTLIGEFSNDGYTHDAQVVSYNGPDVNFQGKEIAFCCNENTVTVVDVTDATDPALISATGYAGSNYTHQGWLTEDHRYFLSNDELDEQSLGINTTTFNWDMADLSAPVLVGTFVSDVAAIDHNLYTHNGLVYQSNYRAGLRVLNTDNIDNGQLEEVGYFDVYPSSDAAQFNGSWSNYPYFPSGVVAVTHIEEGVFFLGLSGELSDYGCMDPTACNYDPTALLDDGSCVAFNECGGCEGEDLFCVGCTDEAACNFNVEATIDDGSCFELDAPLSQTELQVDQPVTFTAEPNSHWFDTESATEPLSVGESFSFPLVASDTSVWVAHSNGEFDVVGGKESPDFANGQYHFNNGYWLVFDVHEDVLFESVEVHSEQGGAHTVEILDADDNMVGTYSQVLTAGLNVFAIDDVLPAGTGYQIRSAVAEPLLWRDDDNADVNFPYDVGGLASIVSTTINGPNQYNFYYFFYNWKMSSANPCLSARTEFHVVVDTSQEVEGPVGAPARTLVHVVDLQGREVTNPRNQVVFNIYSDGTVTKAFVGDLD